ncbi:hypothetical protein LXL04_030111 [Taraxacum kok-saghyz]
MVRLYSDEVDGGGSMVVGRDGSRDFGTKMQTGSKNLGLKCKLNQNMANYLLKRSNMAIVQILSVYPFSENDNSSLKCVTNGGYKLKDIYVDNMLHYFSIDVNMHKNHELTKPRLTLLELLIMHNPGYHTASGSEEGEGIA